MHPSSAHTHLVLLHLPGDHTDGTIEADCHKPSDVIPERREDEEHVENSGTDT